MKIMEFHKEKLGARFFIETNNPYDNKHLLFEIKHKYKNINGESLDSPYDFKILNDLELNKKLQDTVPPKSLVRQHENIIELKKGYFIIDGSKNEIINGLEFNDVISSNDFNNEFYTQSNPLDEVKDLVENSLSGNEGYLILVVLGDNKLKNGSKRVYNKSDTNKSKIINQKNLGYQPLEFLKDYNTKLPLDNIMNEPNAIFLYITRFDIKTKSIIDETYAMQYEESKVEGSSIITPLYPIIEKYDNTYISSDKELFYKNLNSKNKTLYGLNFHTPFNLSDKENIQELEEEIIYDDYLNRKFKSKPLLELHSIEGDEKYKINNTLTILEV